MGTLKNLLAEINEFAFFRALQVLSFSRPTLVELRTFVVNMYSCMTGECVCQSCNTLTVDILHHLVYDCRNDDVNFKRLQFSETVSRNIGTNVSNILLN